MSLSAATVRLVPDVVFQGLCLDTCVPERVGPYWRDLLGLPAEQQAGGDWVLRGTQPGETIWINTVPEPKTVKTRVHLDVRVPDHTGPERWEVRQDPDGLEWCAFAPADGQRAFELVVDAVDARAIAEWWAERAGVEVRNDGQPWWWLEGVAGFPYQHWVFQPVPEPKTVKNRMHWDVTGDVDVLARAGATVLAVLPSWTVMADPEGNEFCVFSA